MRVERRDKAMAANPAIRAKYPTGLATVLKGYMGSVYYGLHTWEEIEKAEIGEIINAPAINTFGWHGPIGTRMTYADLLAEGYCKRGWI